MNLYYALVKRNDENKISDLVFVKESFSWNAFFFSGFWFLYHKMWKEFLLITLITISISFSEKILLASDLIFLQFVFFSALAMNANYWFLQHLEKKDYVFIDSVFAKNKLDAHRNFLEEFSSDQFDDEILMLHLREDQKKNFIRFCA